MWNGPYDMICDWASWGWGWPFGFLFPILLWGLIIAGIVMIVRASTNSGVPPVRRVRSLDVLAERYARGEIERDEFLRKASDIAG
jgi:putative membrane protein